MSAPAMKFIAGATGPGLLACSERACEPFVEGLAGHD
jgi:hypothetical protein